MPRKLKPSALNSQAYFPHDLTIAPEVLAIQTSVTGPGQDMEWLWTWTTSSLPYSRVTITTQAQTSVPLYRQGTYQIDNFAGAETHSGMTQTHSLYLKWIEGAGTANLVPWVTYQNSGVTASHPSINNGTTTQVQRLIINVPSNITIPTSLTAPNVSYNVSTSGNSAFTFTGNAYGSNPNIGPFYRGGTYTFNVSTAGHPFYLTEDSGAGFVAGQYVDEWTSGVTNSRATSGSITFVVPEDAPDVLYYQCGNHASMRGTIRIKDLAVEVNNNGNPIVYFQHTQDNHVTPVELRPIPSLVNQMCVVYDASTSKFVPQDLATYIERTPSFKNKIQEVAGTATLVNADGTPAVSSVKIYPYSNYLPLIGNNPGDVAFTEDTDSLYVWNGTQWKATGTPAAISDKLNTSTGAIDVPSGTTAQRPSSPSTGMIRYNTTIGALEQYTTDGWVGIEPPPLVSSISPTSFSGEQGTTITVNGSNFKVGATVQFITSTGATLNASSTSRISSTQLTATTPRDITVAEEPISIRVTNASGLASTLQDALDAGTSPTWSTSAGTIATIQDRFGSYSPITTIQALDSDSGASIASYSIQSGSLPGGTSLNTSNGQISGDPDNINNSTTYTFSATATDNAGNQSIPRSFNIIVNPYPDGTNSSRAAPSGHWLAQNISGLSTGYYWIKSASMPNALQMWVDMSEEGGGYDFYAIQGGGTSVNYANQSHSGTSLGLDIVYPRSKFHWRAMSNFVRNGGLAGSYSDYFAIVYGVHKTSGGGDYTGTIMRRAANYGSGSNDHRVNDNGRWWIRDSTFSEPNGDYTAYAWFGLQAGGYTFPNPYELQDIGFNDGNANYSTGGYYLVSTNTKP